MNQKSYSEGHSHANGNGPAGADKASEYESPRHTWWWELG